MQPEIQILSTKKIGRSSIQGAAENNICIDELNFIKIEEKISDDMRRHILQLSLQNRNVIFTSANAARAVGKIISGKTSWNIFCIEPATKEIVQNSFKNSLIAASGKNAKELLEKITSYKSIKQIIFFCGNQRRELLPSGLKKAGINVEEIVVYKTAEEPHSLSKKYDGILFFSPSGVRSFFLKNTASPDAVFFAIGDTTAKEIKALSKNRIVTTPVPDTEQLIALMIQYFKVLKPA